MECYQVPAEEARREIEVLNSKFIAIAAPVFAVEEAQQFIRRVRSQFPDASHHVPAYLIGHGASVISHCGDAGEPSGTAGRPVLAVLSGSGLGDIVVVVTRYFGGTKLGTGGLVRAYSQAAREVLAAVPRAIKAKASKINVTLEYSDYEPARNEINNLDGTLINQFFTEKVIIEAFISVDKRTVLEKSLRDLTKGRVQIETIHHEMDVLIPVKSAK